MATMTAHLPNQRLATSSALPTEDELRRVFRRAHDVIFGALARDPAAAFDLLSLTVAAKLHAERVGSQWLPPAGSGPSEHLATLIAAARQWLDTEEGPVSIGSDQAALELLELFEPHEFTRIGVASETDVLGTAYEAMVGATFRGELGAYFTPWSIARFIAEFLDVRGGRIADPACGTGGLLLAAWRHAKHRGGGVACFGNDVNPRMVRAARLNFAVNGMPVERVAHGDGLEVDRLVSWWTARTLTTRPDVPWLEQLRPGPLDAIVANPPFAGFERDPRHLRRTLSAKTTGGRHRGLNKTLPFLESIVSLLREGGVAGLVIPISVLNGDEASIRRCRDVLLANSEIMGIVGLPEDAFVHTDCGIHGALLFLRRTARPRADYDIFVDWIDDVGYDRMGRERPTADFDAVVARHREATWPAHNRVRLSELLAHDRLDPNWLRTARSAVAPAAASVPLTSIFTVRDARIRRAELEDEAEYRFFEVGDADVATGDITSVRTATGAELKRKNRIRLRVRAGDVLLPNHRDSLIARSAPTGRSAVVVGDEADGALTSDRFIVLATALPPDVARLVLNASGTRRQLVALCRGAASLDLRPKALTAVSVPRAMLDTGMVRELGYRADELRRLRSMVTNETAAIRAIVDGLFSAG